ncbi:MAG: penicillin-binding transpeptidase domain-containing protein [Gemmatimonadaceae bacterium]
MTGVGKGSANHRHRRIGLVHASLALLMLGVLGKAAHVQLVQGRAWSDLARRQQFTAREVPAPRGRVLDAGGRTLATTREVVQLEVAPRELRDPRRLQRALLNAKVDASWAARAADRRRKWVEIPGRFVAEDVAAITAMRGVYTTPVSDRTYAMSPGLRPLLGRIANGRGIDGLELTLDSLLRGVPGASRMMRAMGGRSFVSPTSPGLAPTPGHSVTLTINHELQGIAERTLSDAVARLEAEGGDIVIMDPRSGEILAMAGERNGAVSRSVTALTEPFEPGSTLKPLIAAGLLARGRARTTDMVATRGGTYTLHGRTVHDEPAQGPPRAQLSLADVIRYSSNVGIVQFAERLTEREEFETLRDFGLGMPSGLPYAAEAAGTLRPPKAWSRQSQASLAMGYEVAVTPVQLAVAYAAIANGGELLEPALIREIRAPNGAVTFRHERRVVRRAISEEVARTLRTLLADVVERGTALDADLATYAVGGKTGTPRRTVNGRYAPMQYNPNFVGLFPADAPQLVVVVKLTSPKGNFYGGRTAAPMTRTILQAAIAARDAALDRSRLAPRTIAAVQAGRSLAPVAAVARANDDAAFPDAAVASVVIDIPSPPERRAEPPAPRSVPNVRGLTLRDAVRSLHTAGFRVQLTQAASVAGVTEPAPGALAPAGSLVRLRYTR